MRVCSEEIMDRTNSQNIERPEDSFLERDVIGIDGMTCDKCVETIENAFRTQDGVKSVKVDRERALAEVTFDTRKTHIADLHETLLRHGYRPRAVPVS
jgi:copper chaperone CopZ